MNGGETASPVCQTSRFAPAARASSMVRKTRASAASLSDQDRHTRLGPSWSGSRTINRSPSPTVLRAVIVAVGIARIVQLLGWRGQLFCLWLPADS
jgi:anti-sigma factor RsiW